MAKPHTVAEGESLIPIRKRYKFRHHKTIWNAPENAALRVLREHVNAIRTDDVLMIPDPEERSEEAATTARHEFVVVERSRGVWNLRWTPTEGYCGDEVVLTGDTNLTAPSVRFLTKAPGDPFPVPVVNATIEEKVMQPYVWNIHDVWMKLPFKDDSGRVDLETTTDKDTIPCNPTGLTVLSMGDAGTGKFDERKDVANGFQTHGKFDFTVKNFRCDLRLAMDILKGGGATGST